MRNSHVALNLHVFCLCGVKRTEIGIVVFAGIVPELGIICKRGGESPSVFSSSCGEILLAEFT